MTDLAALDALIEAVEAGDYSLATIEDMAVAAIGLGDNSVNMGQAYRGSLDAAKALHDALLPGWDLLITTYEDGLFEVSVSEPLAVKTYDGLSEVIARAWLLATLKAYRVIQTQPT